MLSKAVVQLGRRQLHLVQNFSKRVANFEWSGASQGIEMATTPPSSWYTSQEFASSVEQKHTFNKWLLICNDSTLKNDGDYVARTVNNQPIVIVNSQGTLKAFYNVCRHHAAQLCDDGDGKLGPTGRFSCPYHGWQYNADGKLVKALHMKGCKEFSAKNFGLHSLRLDKLGPWLYVNLDKHGTGTLLEDCPDLTHMHSLLANTQYESLVPVKCLSYEIGCNWKVFVDNYLDGGYHVPVAHPALTASLNLSGYTRSGFDNFYLQTCGAKTDESEPVPHDNNNSNNNHEGAVKKGEHSRISGGGNTEALYIFQYPNVMINM